MDCVGERADKYARSLKARKRFSHRMNVGAEECARADRVVDQMNLRMCRWRICWPTDERVARLMISMMLRMVRLGDVGGNVGGDDGGD